jgi:hypothetical protein
MLLVAAVYIQLGSCCVSAGWMETAARFKLLHSCDVILTQQVVALGLDMLLAFGFST